VFANQPNPYAGVPKRIFGTLGAALVVLFVMLVANMLLAGNRTVFSNGYTFDRQTTEAAFVTTPFELDGRRSGVAIDIGTSLENDWVFFSLALINEATGEAREVSRQVSYYSGSDSDGSWSEGTRSETVRLAAVPAGRYFLRVEPEGGSRAGPRWRTRCPCAAIHRTSGCTASPSWRCWCHPSWQSCRRQASKAVAGRKATMPPREAAMTNDHRCSCAEAGAC
jgi:hypothetical protein